MNKEKVQEATKGMKEFFTKKGLTIFEAKETICRLLDYIDANYDDDERDVPFKNGNMSNGLNGKVNKVDTPQKGIKLEIKNR